MKMSFNVKKKDSDVVRFSPEKIFKSLRKAARSTDINSKKLGLLHHRITERLKETFLPGETILFSLLEKIIIDVLQEAGYSNLARIYYSQSRLKKVGNKIRVLKRVNSSDVTDYSLLVTNSVSIASSPWDRNILINAIAEHSGVERGDAKKIAREIEKKIISAGMEEVSTSLIGELIDNALLERGYSSLISKQTEVGISTYDLEKIILSKGNENSNISGHNPEAVNLAIAEVALKQYSLNRVFSEPVARAHKEGAIHIHDLGYPTRVYCSAHSPEYIKKYGLKLDNLEIISSPARHARTLTGHINTFLASMQAFYAGALGISYVNIFYAPYLVGMNYKEIKQEAQYFIYSLSQSAFSRGGQVLFVDANLHTGIPSYLKNVPAIGPGGEYTGEKYGDYEAEAQSFLRALLEVWSEGDSQGHVFAFPKCDLHINGDTFKDPKQRELLELACKVASINGTPYFIFDRDEVTLSACCRLRTKITDMDMVEHPEKMRFCGFQNVTLNLPQAAYRAAREGQKSFNGLMKQMEWMLDRAVSAHMEKREFVKKMMKKGAPLWPVGKTALDGVPYVDLDSATYIIGVIGLNECLQYLTGFQLHENEDTYQMGLKLISFLFLKVKDLEKKYGFHFSIEESPAESASRRLAKVDLTLFPESKRVVKGSIENDQAYYTNSIHLAAAADVDLVERIEKQARFHPLIESGAMTHAFVGEQKPSPQAIFKIVERSWSATQTAQITISPEFTICEDCGKQSRGLKDRCVFCGSSDVYGMTRIVGYFSKVKNWNKSKLGELADRRQGTYV